MADTFKSFYFSKFELTHQKPYETDPFNKRKQERGAEQKNIWNLYTAIGVHTKMSQKNEIFDCRRLHFNVTYQWLSTDKSRQNSNSRCQRRGRFWIDRCKCMEWWGCIDFSFVAIRMLEPLILILIFCYKKKPPVYIVTGSVVMFLESFLWWNDHRFRYARTVVPFAENRELIGNSWRVNMFSYRWNAVLKPGAGTQREHASDNWKNFSN